MLNLLMVPLIMACALVGTIALLFLAGTSRWSFIYLIRYRLLKREVKNPHFEMSRKRDVVAVIIAIISLIVAAILLIYGVPFVRNDEHMTQEQLAGKLNITIDHLGRIENGRSGLSIDLLIEIAFYFHVSLDSTSQSLISSSLIPCLPRISDEVSRIS